MPTVFSHIVQKRLSRENENVATDALAYILGRSEAARNGMLRLLRGLVPKMPNLRFQAQQTEGSNRPDMWGYDKDEPRVFVENKFWANLTENQPVSYLHQLARHSQPTVLLVVAPDAREQALWRELGRKLKAANISATSRDTVPGIVSSVSTDKGPILALTSWTRLISALEYDAAEDQSATSDLQQLRELCQAADTDVLISAEEVSDQRTPALFLQLGSLVKDSMEKCVQEGSLYRGRLQSGRDWTRIGDYATFSNAQGAGVWFGIEFDLWKLHGGTPLWAVFYEKFGRAREVRELLEPWAVQNGIFAVSNDDKSFAVAIDIPFGEEKDQVIRAIASRFKNIEAVLSKLTPKGLGAQ